MPNPKIKSTEQIRYVRAYLVALYLEKYVNYLRDNNLHDDSDTISIADLFEFVDQNIVPNEED